MINLQNIVLLVLSYVVIPRMTFLPSSIHTLLIVLGPFILPRLLNLFNTSRAASRSIPVRPTPRKVQRALNLLFLSTIICIVLSLPHFADENIFIKTKSRWQIESDVLFTRLKRIRDLTPEDEQLRAKLASTSMHKMIYFAYGPDTLLNCDWCSSAAGSENKNYYLYALPKLLTPHIFHLAALGLATSSLVGPEASRFRTPATIAGLALLAAENWYLIQLDPADNKRAKVLGDINFVHWRVHLYRYLAFAVVDAALALVLWLTSTNRWLARPAPLANRLEAATKVAEETLHKLRALGLLENSINRDKGLREVREEYWRTEGQVMSEAVAEPEVTEKINMAIGRMDFGALEGKVGEVADGILSAIDGLRSSQILSSDAPAAPVS